MEIDDLKGLWAAHGEMLARSLRIDERLLTERTMRRARRALLPYAAMRVVELLVAMAAILTIGPVLAGHGLQWRYVVAGWPVLGWLVAMTAASLRLLVGCHANEGVAAVAAMQDRLLRLRAVEFRALKWALLGGVVVWLPTVLLLFEVATGVDALQRVDLAWLLTNLAFGALTLGLGLRWSHRRLEKGDLGPRAQFVLDAVTSRGVRRALAELAELRQFVRGDAGPA